MERETGDYFDAALQVLTTISQSDRKENAKLVSNWVMTDVMRVMSEKKVEIAGFPVSPGRLAGMIGLIQNGTISGKIAKEVFEEMLGTEEGPQAIVERKGLVQVSDEQAIERVIENVLENNGPQVAQFLAGNEKVFGFFVGETMKLTRGKANPRVVNTILRRKLDARRG
jgi:aspartyl-tRNA(Asn)/glutamyl-tRNA(Gln) amidotransferase subunit B